MPVCVRDVLLMLNNYMPGALSLERVAVTLGTMVAMRLVVALAANQHRYRMRESALPSEIREVIQASLSQELDGDSEVEPPLEALGNRLAQDLPNFFNFLLPREPGPQGDWAPSSLIWEPPATLCTQYRDCPFCLPRRPLFKLDPIVKVNLITRRFELKLAFLVTAQCTLCAAHFFPNRVTRCNEAHGWFQVLECETEYLRVSRKGVWVHRTLAHLQEMAVMQFHMSWLGFCGFVNDGIGRSEELLTVWQVQKMYVEHFARQLLVAHGMWATFQCEVELRPEELIVHILEHLGSRNQGDFEDQDALAAAGVASMAEDRDGALPANAGVSPDEGVRLSQTRLPVQDPGPGATRGWMRMAVMDGKTMVHRICAVKDCRGALMNYRHGQFCEAHISLARICGVDGCEVACMHEEAMTCGNAAHIHVYHQWWGRFSWESFLGVRRGLCTHQFPPPGPGPVGPQSGTQADQVPRLESALALGQAHPQGVEVLPGDPVANLDLGHKFQARHIYCLQTLQWACGVPIGFGKCYGSESTPQVHSFISAMFPIPSSRPAFMCYDNACSLLRHMARQNIDDPWLDSTRFIVDAWHYINHQPADLLDTLQSQPT
ncbi:hypothetical protein JB92DRAFT_3125074 [Gautieria morchelliformis]|nr:hypothetical protein JB92DRAFT_3125074 [Gautieria morchelliformis]